MRPTDRTRDHLEALARQGFTRVRTGALEHGDAASLQRRGWKVGAHLHLLRHDLHRLPRRRRASHQRLRRAADGELASVVALDDAAFPPEWRLGQAGLDDALSATPQARFRIASAAGGLAGYAISGRSGREGYIQRLAVAAEHQGEGLGRALTLDGLRWLKRWGATSASVNTYVGNDVALRLYLSLGFDEVHPGLTVLTIEL